MLIQLAGDSYADVRLVTGATVNNQRDDQGFGLLDLPFIWSVGVDNLVLAYLKTGLDWRQVLSVDTMVHHE